MMMKRNLLKLTVACAAAALSFGANAGPVLDGLAGDYNWKLQGVTSEWSPVTYGNETTWGIGEVTEINKTNGDAAWSKGAGGDYLYYMLYGIADLQVTSIGGSQVDIFNVGCTGGACNGKIRMDIYRMSAPITGILGKSPSDRTGFNAYNGLTNAAGASLYLSLEMVAGKVLADDLATLADETTTTLYQTANSALLPASGTGTFFAEAVGGSAMGKWDTNGFLNGAADFDANFTLKPNFRQFGGACSNTASNQDCFYGLINDPVQSNAIPEPASLALAGLGLLGLAAIRRRRA